MNEPALLKPRSAALKKVLHFTVYLVFAFFPSTGITQSSYLTDEPVWFSGLAADTRCVALGDVDGDGDLDLVCGNYESATLCLNDGEKFQATPAWDFGTLTSV